MSTRFPRHTWCRKPTAMSSRPSRGQVEGNSCYESSFPKLSSNQQYGIGLKNFRVSKLYIATFELEELLQIPLRPVLAEYVLSMYFKKALRESTEGAHTELFIPNSCSSPSFMLSTSAVPKWSKVKVHRASFANPMKRFIMIGQNGMPHRIRGYILWLATMKRTVFEQILTDTWSIR